MPTRQLSSHELPWLIDRSRTATGAAGRPRRPGQISVGPSCSICFKSKSLGGRPTMTADPLMDWRCNSQTGARPSEQAATS